MQKLIRAFMGGLLTASLLAPGNALAAGGSLPYADIDKHWAKNSIIRGVQYGLFAVGDKDPLFYPNREMTRAEFLVMLDRVYYGGQYQLYPLTSMSEHAEWSKGEGFDDSYLPYKDVDRLTWMYRPILRISILLDRLYGPDAIQEVFPGEQMFPNQPISQEEAAKLLLLFTMGEESTYAWEEIRKWGWLEGDRHDPLKRGEAAVAADRLVRYLMQDAILPLLDYDGSKFPVVPEIEEMFPLFVTYTDDKTADEQLYVNAVYAIINQYDSNKTYADLRKLDERDFSNQIGVHYYLSWNPNVSLEENLEEAFRAIDAYFEDKVILPDTLQLLAANVYDLALQIGSEDREQYGIILERLGSYEQKLKPETKEWESLAIYLAALEVKSGKVTGALKRYTAFSSRHPEALLNAAYYWVQRGRMDLAGKLVASVKPHSTDSRMKQLLILLQQDLASLQEQNSIAAELDYSIGRLENTQSFQVTGESMLNGFWFHYTQDVDHRKQAIRTSGHFQSPYKPILEKMEGYYDLKEEVQYAYDPESDTWKKNPMGTPDFLHEWAGSLEIYDRLHELNARYYKQSFGRYDIITEWVPSPILEKKGREVRLDQGRVESAPLFINKYYIDRESDMIVQHFWRYEEVYEGGEFVVYTGTDNFDYEVKVNVKKPGSLGKEVKR